LLEILTQVISEVEGRDLGNSGIGEWNLKVLLLGIVDVFHMSKDIEDIPMKNLWEMLEILTQVIFEVDEEDTGNCRNRGIGTQFYAIDSEILLR